MRTIETQVFTFAELSEGAKERTIECNGYEFNAQGEIV